MLLVTPAILAIPAFATIVSKNSNSSSDVPTKDDSNQPVKLVVSEETMTVTYISGGWQKVAAGPYVHAVNSKGEMINQDDWKFQWWNHPDSWNDNTNAIKFGDSGSPIYKTKTGFAVKLYIDHHTNSTTRLEVALHYKDSHGEYKFLNVYCYILLHAVQ